MDGRETELRRERHGRDRLTLSGYMLVGAHAAYRAEQAGANVISYYDNGKRATIVVDMPPAFVTGVRKASHGNGRGGRSVIYAAPYHGAQLEWVRHDEPEAMPEVAHA